MKTSGTFSVPLKNIYYYIDNQRDIFNPGPPDEAFGLKKIHVRTLGGDGGVQRVDDPVSKLVSASSMNPSWIFKELLEHCCARLHTAPPLDGGSSRAPMHVNV